MRHLHWIAKCAELHRATNDSIRERSTVDGVAVKVVLAVDAIRLIELLVMMESMARIGLRIGIGGFGCIGWDGRLLDRGEKQLRAVVSKGCSPLFRERIVGDNGTDFAKGTEFGQARSTKLTAIGHDDGLIRAAIMARSVSTNSKLLL